MASLLKKLGNVERNNTTYDEQSKSAIGNAEQYYENRNVIVSPKNENNINKTPIEKKTFKFPTSTNTSSQNIVNPGLTNMVQPTKEKDKINSPRAATEKIESKNEFVITRQGSDHSYDKVSNKESKLMIPSQTDPPPLQINKKVSLNSNLLQILTSELTNNLSPSSRHPTQIAFNATSPPLESQMQKEMIIKNEINSPNLPFQPNQGKYTSSQKVLQNRDDNPTLPLKATINLTNEVLQTNNSKPVRVLVRQGSHEANKKNESKSQQQLQSSDMPLLAQSKTQPDMIQMIKVTIFTFLICRIIR